MRDFTFCSVEFLFAHVYILYRMNEVDVYLSDGFFFEELNMFDMFNCCD